MKVKIGIPRGMGYYEHFPLWKGFYERLGAEVIISDPTNKGILEAGVKSTVDESCLPLKIFHGHVLNLKDRVDYLLIPKLMSYHQGEYICPKFCGLPEMVKHSIPDLPPIIDGEINFNRSQRGLYRMLHRFASVITSNPIKILQAYQGALEDYRTFLKELQEGYLPRDGVWVKGTDRFSNKVMGEHRGNRRRIALLGHPYLIYDSFASMELIQKLQEAQAEVIIPEMFHMDTLNRWAATLEKPMFWSYGRKILGTALHLGHHQAVDGVIYLSAFGCGIDSVIVPLFERWSQGAGDLPLLILTIDEHTGEAGVNTRLEAFLDMLEWRQQHESNLSSHG